ncbi:MAG TPA: tetratricopeptide repeat protein [Terriglobia bacterium]|nr:tetratricopeptide repeat protein [Terriglobia bacterium]
MFSSRNIHFAILGIILGATCGYLVAFYQAQSQAQAAMPPNHPPVSTDSSLDALKSAVDRNPSDADAAMRYANALFTANRTPDAISYWERALSLRPDDLSIRSMLGAVLWSEGRPEEARKHLQIAITQNPHHVPSLHAMLLITLETDRDEKKAAAILKTIEEVDPEYSGLPDLRDRLARFRAPAGE